MSLNRQLVDANSLVSQGSELPQEVRDLLADMAEYHVDEIGWDLKRPCADCPFVRTSPAHEGVAGSLPAYMESIESNQFAHSCHKTDMRPECDGPHTWHGKPQHCVGALMMLLKTGEGMDLQLPLLQAAQEGKLDLAEMTAAAKANADVFTVKELLAFYLKWIKHWSENGRSSDKGSDSGAAGSAGAAVNS